MTPTIKRVLMKSQSRITIAVDECVETDRYLNPGTIRSKAIKIPQASNAEMISALKEVTVTEV